MITVHCPPDGFCFFHALSMFLRKSKKPDTTHMQYVRDHIIVWLWKYWEKHKRDKNNMTIQTLSVAAQEERKSVRDYLLQVHRRGFGGAEMHIGASNVFKVRVIVHAPKPFESARPMRGHAVPFHVKYSGGIHYDLLTEK